MARCGSCQTINRGLNTPGRRCVQCDHAMVFNAANDGFSDVRLMKAMEHLSAGGRLAYTESQLYYAVTGRRLVKPGVVTRLRRAPKVPEHPVAALSPDRFQSNLARWRQSDATVIGNLLLRAQIADDQNRQPRDGTVLHPELTAHGFERAVVVDHAPTAVMLVANNFHIDHRCAVLSEDGYPEAFRSELVEVLNREPNLTVAVVHGASVAGAGMIHRLRSWFPEPSIRLIEVGLRPAQVVKANYPVSRDARRQPDAAVLDDPVLSRLDAWEREWLAWGLSARLDCLSPQSLMTAIGRVFNAMARADERDLIERASIVGQPDHDVDLDVGLVETPSTSTPITDRSGSIGGIYWWDQSRPLTPGSPPAEHPDEQEDDQDDDLDREGDGVGLDAGAMSAAAFAMDDGFDGSDFDGDG